MLPPMKKLANHMMKRFRLAILWAFILHTTLLSSEKNFGFLNNSIQKLTNLLNEFV